MLVDDWYEVSSSGGSGESGKSGSWTFEGVGAVVVCGVEKDGTGGRTGAAFSVVVVVVEEVVVTSVD